MADRQRDRGEGTLGEDAGEGLLRADKVEAQGRVGGAARRDLLDTQAAAAAAGDERGQLAAPVLNRLERGGGGLRGSGELLFEVGDQLLPTASAYENGELGLRLAGGVPRKEWNARIRRCLGAVGLTAWIDHRPYEMSGGQQQRVAIARALAIRPRLILADEPTGDLDRKTGQQILSLVRALVDHEDVTLVMATHDPAAADFATDLYQLRDGQIAERIGAAVK